jgi:hypothetical protein
VNSERKLERMLVTCYLSRFTQIWLFSFQTSKVKERLLRGSNNPCVTAPEDLKRKILRFTFDVSGAGTPLPLNQSGCAERVVPVGLG